MAKGKRRVSSGGPRKSHGPKRKMFHQWSRSTRIVLAQAGLLSKYYNFESFRLACMARGIKNPTRAQFDQMWALKTKQDKDAWFKNLKGE